MNRLWLALSAALKRALDTEVGAYVVISMMIAAMATWMIGDNPIPTMGATYGLGVALGATLGVAALVGMAQKREPISRSQALFGPVIAGLATWTGTSVVVDLTHGFAIGISILLAGYLIISGALDLKRVMVWFFGHEPKATARAETH